MAEPKRIRIGIIGAGGNTRAKHIPGLRAIPGVEVVAVANRSLESTQRVCAELGIPRAEAKPEAIWKAKDIDAVVIGTWPYRHCPYVLAALAHGKHVLTEARMAMNASEARRMLSAAKKHPKLVAMVVPSPYSLSYDHAVYEAVKSHLGELIQVDLYVTSGVFPVSAGPLTWRHEARYSGNNAMSLGIYYEALLRWLGPARDVQALTRTVVTHRASGQAGKHLRVSVPDLVQVQGTLARHPALYRILVSDALGQRKAAECIIQGTRASFRVPFDSTLWIRKPGDKEEMPFEYKAAPGWRVEAEFIGAIRGEEPVRRTTFADGVAYMSFTDAVHASAKSGRAVTVK